MGTLHSAYAILGRLGILRTVDSVTLLVHASPAQSSGGESCTDESLAKQPALKSSVGRNRPHGNG